MKLIFIITTPVRFLCHFVRAVYEYEYAMYQVRKIFKL